MAGETTLFDNEALRASREHLSQIAQVLEARLPRAAKETGDAAAKTSAAWDKLNGGLESSVRTFNELTEAAGKIAGALEAIGEASVAAEQTEQATRELGGELQRLKTASGESVSAIELNAAKHKLLQSGLKLTADQYAVLVRAAHDHTDASRTTTQELEKLTEAFGSGSAEALTQYGVKVKEGESRSAAASKAIAKFREEQRKAGPVTVTMKDQVAGLKGSFSEATTAIVGMIAKVLHLKEVFATVSTSLRTLARDISQVTGSDTAGQAARQAGVASSASEIAAHGEQLAGRADLRQRIAVLQSQIQDSVRGQGGQFNVGDTSRLNDQQLGALFTRLRDLRARTSSGSMAALGFSGGGNANAAAIVAAEQQAIYANFDRAASSEAQTRRAADARRTAAIAATTPPATAPGTDPNHVIDANRVRAGGGGGPSAQELAEMRQKLSDMQRAQALGAVQSALGTANASANGQQLAGDLASVQQLATLAETLRTTTLKERAELDGIMVQLASRNLSLKHRLELEERVQSVQQQQRAGQLALLAIEERQRNLKRANLELTQQRVASELSLYQQAIASREAGLQLTASESAALQQKVEITTRLKELEAGLSAAATEAGAQAQAATTQEAKNAALQRELQLRLQIAQVQGQVRTEETAARERASRDDFGTQMSRRLIGQTRETATLTQKFAGVAVDALNAVGDGIASNIVAVAQGQKTFGEAMRDMLRDFLAMMTKRSIVEALSNSAMAAAAAFTPGRQLEAVGYATAAGIWGAVGVVAGGALAGVSAASASPSAPAGASASAPRAASVGGQSSSQSRGGDFILSVSVNGALYNDGVARATGEAVERAAQRNYLPAYRRGRLQV